MPPKATSGKPGAFTTFTTALLSASTRTPSQPPPLDATARPVPAKVSVAASPPPPASVPLSIGYTPSTIAIIRWDKEASLPKVSLKGTIIPSTSFTWTVSPPLPTGVRINSNGKDQLMYPIYILILWICSIVLSIGVGDIAGFASMAVPVLAYTITATHSTGTCSTTLNLGTLEGI
jgi:hypothetical protein